MPKVFWKNFTQTFCYASSIFGCWVFIKFYQRNALFSYYGNIRFLFFPKSYGQMFKSLFHCCWPSVDLYWWFMSFCANISITCSTTAELFNWLVFLPYFQKWWMTLPMFNNLPYFTMNHNKNMSQTMLNI